MKCPTNYLLSITQILYQALLLYQCDIDICTCTLVQISNLFHYGGKRFVHAMHKNAICSLRWASDRGNVPLRIL